MTGRYRRRTMVVYHEMPPVALSFIMLLSHRPPKVEKAKKTTCRLPETDYRVKAIEKRNACAGRSGRLNAIDGFAPPTAISKESEVRHRML